MAREPPCGVRGDVNSTGDVDIGDVQAAYYLTNKDSYTDDELKRADVNGDGDITVEDVGLINDFQQGNIDTFPVCSSSKDDSSVSNKSLELLSSVNDLCVGDSAEYRFQFSIDAPRQVTIEAQANNSPVDTKTASPGGDVVTFNLKPEIKNWTQSIQIEATINGEVIATDFDKLTLDKGVNNFRLSADTDTVCPDNTISVTATGVGSNKCSQDYKVKFLSKDDSLEQKVVDVTGLGDGEEFTAKATWPMPNKDVNIVSHVVHVDTEDVVATGDDSVERGSINLDSQLTGPSKRLCVGTEADLQYTVENTTSCSGEVTIEIESSNSSIPPQRKTESFNADDEKKFKYSFELPDNSVSVTARAKVGSRVLTEDTHKVKKSKPAATINATGPTSDICAGAEATVNANITNDTNCQSVLDIGFSPSSDEVDKQSETITLSGNSSENVPLTFIMPEESVEFRVGVKQSETGDILDSDTIRVSVNSDSINPSIGVTLDELPEKSCSGQTISNQASITNNSSACTINADVKLKVSSENIQDVTRRVSLNPESTVNVSHTFDMPGQDISVTAEVVSPSGSTVFNSDTSQINIQRPSGPVELTGAPSSACRGEEVAYQFDVTNESPCESSATVTLDISTDSVKTQEETVDLLPGQTATVTHSFAMPSENVTIVAEAINDNTDSLYGKDSVTIESISPSASVAFTEVPDELCVGADASIPFKVSNDSRCQANYSITMSSGDKSIASASTNVTVEPNQSKTLNFNFKMPSGTVSITGKAFDSETSEKLKQDSASISSITPQASLEDVTGPSSAKIGSSVELSANIRSNTPCGATYIAQLLDSQGSVLDSVQGSISEEQTASKSLTFEMEAKPFNGSIALLLNTADGNTQVDTVDVNVLPAKAIVVDTESSVTFWGPSDDNAYSANGVITASNPELAESEGSADSLTTAARRSTFTVELTSSDKDLITYDDLSQIRFRTTSPVTLIIDGENKGEVSKYTGESIAQGVLGLQGSKFTTTRIER